MGVWEGHTIELFPINTKTILGKKVIYSEAAMAELFDELVNEVGTALGFPLAS